jgi:hypothetical protein
MIKNKKALSPVVSVVLVLMIVTSTIVVVLSWGVPYTEKMQSSQKKESTLNQLTSLAETIDRLTYSSTGDRRVNPIDLHKGSVEFKQNNISNRMIVSYSLEQGYNFTVSGFQTGNCFLAGTQVLMADGSYKNIEDVKVGDYAFSFDEKTKQIRTCRVSRFYSNTKTDMISNYYLIINKNIQVTPDHRFYSNGGWTPAGDLRIGDNLFSFDQTEYIVYSIEKIYNKEATYNLEVEDCHNYFVLSKSDNVNVLVHNGGKIPMDPSEYKWVSPQSHHTPTVWFNPGNAHDEQLETPAIYRRDNWSTPWLRLKPKSEHDPNNLQIACVGFRIYAKNHQDIEEMQIRMRNDGETVEGTDDIFHDWFNGEHGFFLDVNYDGIKIVDEVQIRFYQSEGFGVGRTNAAVYDFYFNVTIPTCDTLDLEDSDIGTKSATVHGKVTDDKGIPCVYKFEYDTNKVFNDPKTLAWSGSINHDGTFSGIIPRSNQPDLKPAHVYYYRAQVSHSSAYFNLIGSGDGGILSFITKPEPPDNIKATSPTDNTVSLSWTKSTPGTGVTVYTKILAKTDGWPSQYNDDSADVWYCNTGTSMSKEGLIPGTRYNVSMWSYAENETGDLSGWSQGYDDIVYTRPSDIENFQANAFGSNTINLSWIKADGADRTVIRRSTKGYPNLTTGEEVYNGTDTNFYDNIPYSVQNYYYSAWGYNIISGYFSKDSKGAYVEMVYTFAVTSPEAGERWRAGSTRVISWAYASSYSDYTLDISLEVGSGESHNKILIIEDIDIKDKSYNWNIPRNQASGEYRLIIDASKPGAETETFSTKIYITPVYNNIVDNVTISNTQAEDDNNYTIQIPAKTHSGNDTNQEIFYIDMISGSIDRAEVYWLSYDDNDVTIPYSLKGLICMDLYDGNLLFGNIWIFDSDSITYDPISSEGIDKLILEHGGIIHSESSNSYINRKPFIYLGSSILSLHIVQTVSPYYSIGGTANYRFRVFSRLYNSYVIEDGVVKAYNIKLQFFGSNNQIWYDYFVNDLDFTNFEGTLFYKPSSDPEGIQFSFSYSTVLFEIQ